MTGLLQHWDRFWFRATGPYRIAAFRIALGAYLIVYWAALAPHVEIYFSDLGVQVPYLVPDYAPGVAMAHALYLATFLLILLFTVGARTSIVTPLLLAAYLHHYFLEIAIKHSSFERLLIVYLVIMCFAESARVWSWDARAKPVARSVPVWPERLLMIQTILLYLGSGLWKAFDPGWQAGIVLWATLQSMWATPLAFSVVRVMDTEASWAYLSWAVVASEILLAPLFLYSRTRSLACALGVGFHLVNCVVLVVPEFLLATTPYVLFIRSKTLARLRRLLPVPKPRP